MKRTARLLITVILFNLIWVNSVQSVFAGVSEDYTVRIGLVSTYGDKESIIIKNNRLSMGYGTDGNYTENVVLESTEGFVFKADDSVCYASLNSYSTYNEVLAAIGALKERNEYVYSALCGNNLFRIYISSDSDATTSSIAQALSVSSKMQFEPVNDKDNYRVRIIYSGSTLIVEADSNNYYPQFMAASENEAGEKVLDLGERQYRGRMEIGRFGSSKLLTAVNIVPMEDYLYGVVPCEMVTSWEMEALKAQAVCARSYAYAIDKRNTVFNAENGYALYDTTKSQVYKGYGFENVRTNEAVDATRGLMIYYRDNVIKAFFYSTSGGYTASCEDVWDVPLTYFRGVSDNTELHQEKAPWIVSKTKSQIASILLERGTDVGSVNSLSAAIKDQSGRIYKLKVNGTGGTGYLYKENISSAFSLPSTKVKIIKYGDVPDRVYVCSRNSNEEKQISTSYVISGNGNISQVSSELDQYIVISDDNLTNFPKSAPADTETVYFAGMGYGHGVGLSQSGAQSLAEAGYDYEYIIHHYYNRVDIR